MKSPAAQRPAGQVSREDGGDLAEALGEFDAVLAEFSCPAGRRRFFYGEHLERMKRRSSASVSDGSGLSDSEKRTALLKSEDKEIATRGKFEEAYPPLPTRNTKWWLTRWQ